MYLFIRIYIGFVHVSDIGSATKIIQEHVNVFCHVQNEACFFACAAWLSDHDEVHVLHGGGATSCATSM